MREAVHITSQCGTSLECREQGAREQEQIKMGQQSSPHSDRGDMPGHALEPQPCAIKVY